MNSSLSVVALLLCVAVNSLRAEEIPVDSRIASIGLFKNGLAVVRRTVELPKAGRYRLDSTPNPVHGTFWIESPTPVTARATWREVDSPLRNAEAIDFQQELVGKSVTIHFREGGIPPVAGKVVEVAATRDPAAWNCGEEQRRGYAPPPQGRFLIIESANGRIYADSSMIAYLAVDGPVQTVKQRVPVLLLDHEGEKPMTITITYLTRGIAWAPSYRINLDDSKRLTLEQQAVVKNELEDFADADLQLISGFPSVQFGHVLSPISPETTWANFFNQLNQPMSPHHDVIGNRIIEQQVRLSRDGNDPGVDFSALPMGEGVDLHYQPIGKQTMAVGDALSLPIASGKADYERIVEWIVPDARDANGQYTRDNPQDAAWDAVRFKNPLPFAMTTAPATITADGKFNCQRTSYWVNAGEQTTIQVTKALSIRTKAVEHEEQQPEQREIVYPGGRRFQKVNVKGELSASNHRQENVTLAIRRQFSGELIEAQGDPQTIMREEGVYSVNRRNELQWTLNLKPGETVTLTYRYTVLVNY